MRYDMTPSVKRRARVYGCHIHGHVYAPESEDRRETPNDPIFAASITVNLKCINCGHPNTERREELRDEYVEVKTNA